MQTETNKRALGLSFEFFPPHNAEANLRLWRSVERLAPLGPDFVSVTYGAGGTTRERTNAAMLTIRDRARLNIAGHLTCVGATRQETLDVARGYAKLGATRIVALRGDKPKGADRFEPHPDGFQSAAELVSALHDIGDFKISVAAYPEKHPEAASEQADIDNLKRKIDAGASEAITQFFFENDTFLRFRDKCVAAGIDVPILPGILPVENFGKMVKFAARCATSVPDWMHQAFGNAQNTQESTILATAIAVEMCDELRDEGVGHFHFYTLNNPDLTYDICQGLGVPIKALSTQAGGLVA
ncbi:MAG: methylenetetrahydrofolate reductase [NAD(P)H] [Rhodobacteraceae bacterium]|nr:methylenetetrahydrofolate reductase [NAD(P)H] [Paracoccaceae bacterium]